MTRRERTITAVAILGTSVLWVLGLTVGTRLSGHFVTLQRSGGDRTGTPLLALPDSTEPAGQFSGEFAAVPSRVILLIADGVGFSQLQAARYALTSPEGRLTVERFPVAGWITTHARSTLRIDSASTASALASGRKVEYGQLSIDSNNIYHRTIAEAAVGGGVPVGLLTDSYLWDATMAAFLVHTPIRGEYEEVARQMAQSGVDLLIGEAMLGQDLDTGIAGPGAAVEFAANGFSVVRAWDEVENITIDETTRIAAILPRGVIADRAQSPRLVDLARFAIDLLDSRGDTFFLVIETEETDSASHRADFPRMVRGLEDINEVADLVVEYASQHPDTLVVFTSDHETGGMALLTGNAEEPMGVRWATTVHTAEPVPLLAFGAGADHFAGVQDNTQVAQTLANLLGLELRSEPGPPVQPATVDTD